MQRVLLATSVLATMLAAASACGGGGSAPAPTATTSTTASSTPVDTPRQSSAPRWVEVSPADPLVSFADYVMDVARGKLWRAELPDPAPDRWARVTSWMPDGRALVVRDEESAHAFYAGLPGQPLTALPFTTDGSAPVWSPDGRYLAVGRNQDNNSETAVLDAKTLSQLASHTQTIGGFSGWSADGRYIALNAGDKMLIWDWRSGATQELTASLGAWSSQGTKFAYEPQAPPTSNDVRALEVRILDVASGRTPSQLC